MDTDYHTIHGYPYATLRLNAVDWLIYAFCTGCIVTGGVLLLAVWRGSEVVRDKPYLWIGMASVGALFSCLLIWLGFSPEHRTWHAGFQCSI